MKSWIESRTNKFGSVLVALGLAIVALPELQDVIDQLPTEYHGIVVLVVGIITMIFRHVTIGPLSTNSEGREMEFAIEDLLYNIGCVEAILISNGIHVREVKSSEEIEDANMRDLYVVWSAMEHVNKLR